MPAKGLVRHYFLDGFATIAGTRLPLESVVVVLSQPLMAIGNHNLVKQITFEQHHNGPLVRSAMWTASGF